MYLGYWIINHIRHHFYDLGVQKNSYITNNVIFIAQQLPLYERQNDENWRLVHFCDPESKNRLKNNIVWSYFYDATPTVLMMLRHFTTFLYWDPNSFSPDLTSDCHIYIESIFFIVITRKTRPRHHVHNFCWNDPLLIWDHVLIKITSK